MTGKTRRFSRTSTDRLLSGLVQRYEDEAWSERPILFLDQENSRVLFCFSRRQLTGSAVAPRSQGIPRLTDAQAEALDAVHFAADRNALRIQLEKGDIQFVNNLGVFHSREAFVDGDDVERKRHMIRMWLRNEELAWPTPASLKPVWDPVYGSGIKPVWHVSPDHSAAHVIGPKKSCHG